MSSKAQVWLLTASVSSERSCLAAMRNAVLNFFLIIWHTDSLHLHFRCYFRLVWCYVTLFCIIPECEMLHRIVSNDFVLVIQTFTGLPGKVFMLAQICRWNVSAVNMYFICTCVNLLKTTLGWVDLLLCIFNLTAVKLY